MNELDVTTTAEDDRLRSEYVRRLHLLDQHVEPAATITIPRVLVQFWDNAKAIPADVRECIDSWQPLEEQGFTRLLFDDDTARDFIVDNFTVKHLEAFVQCRHPAMRADYFRLCFILKQGGFYVDADDVYRGGSCTGWFRDDRLKLQPLCYDISSDSMIDPRDFLENPSDSADRVYYANNNPLIAPPDHPIIRAALARSTRMLLRRVSNIRDIQSTTGPGNLTTSLVQHAVECELAGIGSDFAFLTDWGERTFSKWPLEYRNDQRNWRLWVTATHDQYRLERRGRSTL